MHDILEEKSQRPKWLRAIRMVGINLLEQDESKKYLAPIRKKSSTVSDLFLDAILFSANPDVLLDQLTQHLFDSKALLARRLVRRAMVVCSVPGLLADRKAAAGEVVTSVHRTMQRDPKPYHASFGSLLQFLERNVDAVVEHLPHDAAKMTRMWLEMTPVEWPYRASAAKVALALCQNLVLGDKQWSATEDEASEEIFKAVFFAFEDYPQDATNLLLNAAGLEPIAPVQNVHKNAQMSERRNAVRYSPNLFATSVPGKRSDLSSTCFLPKSVLSWRRYVANFQRFSESCKATYSCRFHQDAVRRYG